MTPTGKDASHAFVPSPSRGLASPSRPAGAQPGTSSPALPRALAGARPVPPGSPCSGLRALARAVVCFASDLEDLFLPVRLLESRQPRVPVPARPADPDTKATRVLARTPLAMAWHETSRALATWLAQRPVPDAGGRAALFADAADARARAVRETLAQLVQGDCGDVLRKVVQGCVETVAAKLAGAKPAPTPTQVQILLVTAFRSHFAEAAKGGLGSAALWAFLHDVTEQVSRWESKAGGDKAAAPHVAPNILVACGLQAVARSFAAAPGPNQALYRALVQLAPALAGASGPGKDVAISVHAAPQVVHAAADVMSHCAGRLVAASVEAHRQAQLAAAGEAGPRVALPGRSSVSRTPSTRIEVDTPSMADLRAALVAADDD